MAFDVPTYEPNDHVYYTPGDGNSNYRIGIILGGNNTGADPGAWTYTVLSYDTDGNYAEEDVAATNIGGVIA